jgi:hypothetical protein
MSTSELQTWWASSPCWRFGVYIGGATATDPKVACAIPTASYVSTVGSYGWSLVFIWDDLQPPCTSPGHPISTDPTTAYNQGYNAANAELKRFGQTLLTTSDGGQTWSTTTIG